MVEPPLLCLYYSVQDLRTGIHWFDSLLSHFFRIDNGHCEMMHSSLTFDHCFNYNENYMVVWESTESKDS